MTAALAAPSIEEPTVRLTVNGDPVTLLGTAHVSKASVAAVEAALAGDTYDAVAVELCRGRLQALTDPDAVARLDIVQAIRNGQAPMIAANLALGAYQQRLAEQLGVEPGAELKLAAQTARRRGFRLALIDRDIGTTLRRAFRRLRWWQRMALPGALLAGVFSREKVSEDDVERLKSGDMLDGAFRELAEERPELAEVLIDERDRYMAASIRQAVQANPGKRWLAVVGAGHLAGMQRYLSETPAQPPDAEIAALKTVPPGVKVGRWIPWIIVAVVLAGFAWGFSRSSDLGWQLVLDWVLINGGLAALGAALAMGHPLTILTGFVAAPLTSLNPAVGAGMVTGFVEALLRRPSVGDLHRLRQDTARLSGWWRNRLTRVLLVFVFSTIGSAVGTYVAGFRIFGRLVA